MIAAAKAAGNEPDRGKLNVPLLMEAQEILKIDSWVVVNPEGALVVPRPGHAADDPTGGPFAALLAELRREAVRHRPHAAAEAAHQRPLRRPRDPDRHRDADELLQGPPVGARDRWATS